jgi:hypothetical protein
MLPVLQKGDFEFGAQQSYVGKPLNVDFAAIVHCCIAFVVGKRQTLQLVCCDHYSGFPSGKCVF